MKLEGIVQDTQTIGDNTRFRLKKAIRKRSGQLYEGWFLSEMPLPQLQNGQYVRGQTDYDRPQHRRVILDPRLSRVRRLEPPYEPHLPLAMLEIYGIVSNGLFPHETSHTLLHTYLFSRLERKDAR